ncbi:hypothetical protein NW759_011888 [Fusarium solani]|jgi:hypothetical protein|nr:hypothetical protein NW759_011888 [Fusarium solani]
MPDVETIIVPALLVLQQRMGGEDDDKEDIVSEGKAVDHAHGGTHQQRADQ